MNNLNIYIYNKEEYFIATEIINLLGYKNNFLTKSGLSNNNKLLFRNFLGVKQPKQDPRQILINRDGIYELLKKSRKVLSNETIDILNKINIHIKIKNEKILESEEITYDDGKITIYKHIKDGITLEYFIAKQIITLIGYTNITQKISCISDCNKIQFKNFLGIKIPKQNGKIILITRDGIYELLKKNRKVLSCETIDILKEINIIINKTEEEYEFEDEYKQDRELTTYEYISNGLYFEYFVGYEIVSLIGYKNVSQVITNNVSKSNLLEFKDYPGPKKPKLDPKTILITRDGAIEILIKTRKRISPDVLHILKKFNIDTTNRKCLTKEQQTLSAITNTFKTEKFEDQYKIGSYYLDLYFPEYKIVVECDENGHADRKPYKERDRMDYVNEKLEMDDTNWIRFNPDEHDFDVSKVIGKIYRKIDEIKQEKYKKILDETKKEPQQEPIYFQKPEWTLQIEPITGKFTTPPKEFLIEKLKTHNISDIAKSFGCSTKPINRWLKEYDIKIKDFHNVEPPPEDELISHCKTKTQTEVALHYNVSNHIIRKWLKYYNTDFAKIKLQTKTISKEELLKLKNNFTDDEIAKQTNLTVLNIKKLMQTHNVDKIPTKEELEKNLHEKSKDELALIYNTTRTTMRKWIRTYGLENIRYQSTANNKKISTVDENGSINIFPSIKKLCKVKCILMIIN